MRIKYPDSWSQVDRDALDALFERARREGLWFFHNGISGQFWYSPDELQAEQENGKFIWGAVNWQLRDPHDYLRQANAAIEAAHKEYDAISIRIFAGLPR